MVVTNTKITQTLSKLGPSEFDSTTGRKSKSFIYTLGKCQRTGSNLITCRCVEKIMWILFKPGCVCIIFNTTMCPVCGECVPRVALLFHLPWLMSPQWGASRLENKDINREAFVIYFCVWGLVIYYPAALKNAPTWQQLLSRIRAGSGGRV